MHAERPIEARGDRGRAWDQPSATGDETSVETTVHSGDPGPSTHPHPLANELTDDPSLVELPGADPRTDRESAAIGSNRGGKRAIGWGAVIAGVVMLLALIICALVFRAQRELIVVGAFALAAYGLLLAAPVLLAAGTKVMQDEATRETALHSREGSRERLGRESRPRA